MNGVKILTDIKCLNSKCLICEKCLSSRYFPRKWIFDAAPDDPAYNPLPEDERPGGFQWGEGQAAGVNRDEDDANRQQGL